MQTGEVAETDSQSGAASPFARCFRRSCCAPPAFLTPYAKSERTGDAGHLARLQRYWKQHRAFPAMSKLCEVVELSSSASVFRMVGRLKEAGCLQRLDGRVAPGKMFFARPLLGPVRAGSPEPEAQSASEVPTLDDFLIDQPDRTSLHRVRGDSMTGAGIEEGDLVAVEHNAATKRGRHLPRGRGWRTDCQAARSG